MNDSKVSINVNDRMLTVPEGANLLEILLDHGFRVPAICYLPALKHPIGACRLCVVDVSYADSIPHTRRACLVKTSEGLIVQTESPDIHSSRERAMAALLKQAPQAERLHRLAGEFHIAIDPPPDGCIRCRLCEQVCKEIVGAVALTLEKRGERRYIVPVEDRCIGCGTCANICPTQVIHISDDETMRTISIRDEVIGRHPLAVCEGCGRRFATMKFLDAIHHRTHDHPDLKEHHRYCPECAKRLSSRILKVQLR